MSGVSSRLMMAGELLDAVARGLASAMFGAPLALKNEDLLNQYRNGARWALEREREAVMRVYAGISDADYHALIASYDAALAKEPK